MRKSLLISLFTLCLLNVLAQPKTDAFKHIQQVRDNLYTQLKTGKISTAKAIRAYRNLQQGYFDKKDYANYIEIFLFMAVDVYVTNDDYEQASKSILEGLDALKYVKGENYDMLFFQLNAELSEYYRRMPNRLRLAEKHFKKGYDFFLQKKELEYKIPAFVITFLSNYGRLIDDFGDTEQSFYYFQQARQIAKQQKVTLNQYAVLSNMAKYYREKKQYEEALNLLKEALPLAESDDKTAIVHLSIGICYNQMKRVNDALKALSEAEKYYRKSEEQQPRLWINIQINRAEGHLALGQLNQAEIIYKNALKDFTKKFHYLQGAQVARIENGLSEIYERKGQIKEALTHCQQAMMAADSSYDKRQLQENPTFEGVNAPQELFVGLNQKADLLNKIDPILASDTYLAAIKFATHLRKTFDMPESKLFYSEKVYPVYEKALAKIFEQWSKKPSNEWAEKFFYVLEASKSATLWDAVKAQRIRPKVLDDGLLTEEATLRQKIVKLQIKLLESGNEKTLSDLSDAKFSLAI